MRLLDCSPFSAPSGARCDAAPHRVDLARGGRRRRHRHGDAGRATPPREPLALLLITGPPRVPPLLITGVKLRELLVWQLVTGYRLRELEAREELNRALTGEPE